jgi:hypothetical protein
MKVEEILKPKSEEEILSHLNKLKLNKLLVKSAELGIISSVKLALERGAA